MSEFIHLHTHSHYSLLSALPKIPELVDAAVKHQMEALAITDNGNLYGAIEFYKECLKRNIKPIIGVDFYIATRTRFDKEANIDNKSSRIVLLAKNEMGYKNLIKLVTLSHLEGFYYKPRVDMELLRKYAEGLIAISPSFGGKIWHLLRINDNSKADSVLKELKEIYNDNLYLEITHHPNLEGHSETLKKLADFAKRNDTPLVAGHNIFYINSEDKLARNTMISIQANADWLEKLGNNEEDFSFISPETISKNFKDYPQALENSRKIADLCNLELKLGTWVFPNFKIPEGTTYESELRRLVAEGLLRRSIEKTKEVEERIEYELGVIIDKGFAPYFLVVGDLLRFAKENGILSNTRGSAAGSMVSFLIGITNINPIDYKLPFERFLNPERPKAPDIDMDFADNRRDEVIQYAKDKYGEDKVAQIGTFGKMMARGVVRDVARALGYAYGLGDKIAKLIPMGSQGFPMTIERAIKITPELKEMYEKDADVKRVIDLGKKIEGCARHISIHAGGVIIAPEPLTEFTPIQLDPKGGKIITQYDMHSVEDAGLLKFDFLGLKNLAILADAINIVRKTAGVEIDIDNIPLDDKKTFQMLSKGDTAETFQLNGSGMTRYLIDLKPSSITDINAMVALYRPGPMESIPEYIKRKHNPKLISYLDKRMMDILDQSYGVITYQDDVMLIAIKLGGYSWLEADKLRKAMGKKIPAEMAAQELKLKEGFIKNGMTKSKAEELWKLIEPFAAYGFNKAHAASYGMVAYQTSYMKANFPTPYMAAVLTADSGNVEKISEIIRECDRMKIKVLPPDINESFGNFTVIKDDEIEKIRFGLYSIKNFGEGIAERIIAERKINGEFKSIEDFLLRIRDRNLNKKSLESLIKSGAFDNLSERADLFRSLEDLLTFNKEASSRPEGQDSLFSAATESSHSSLKLKKDTNITKDEMLSWEKELLGLYISGHPLDKFREKLGKREMDIEGVKNNMREGMPCVVSGIIEDIKTVMTKSGEKMSFIKIADFGNNIEVVAFPRTLKEYEKILLPEKCISIRGKFSSRNGSPSIVAEAMKEM